MSNNRASRIKLGQIAWQLSELLQLNDLIEQNQGNKPVVQLLRAAASQPITILEGLGVDPSYSKAFFLLKAKLTYAAVDQFNQDYQPPASIKVVPVFGKYASMAGKGCLHCLMLSIKPKRCYYCLTNYGKS